MLHLFRNPEIAPERIESRIRIIHELKKALSFSIISLAATNQDSPVTWRRIQHGAALECCGLLVLQSQVKKNSTMSMAMRHVVKRYEMELDPRKEFKELIPSELLVDESADVRQRIEYLWTKFVSSVNDLCKTRRNMLVNKNIRKTVFHSAMENLCGDFSRRQENIKVKVVKNITRGSTQYRVSYRLVLVRLSAVPTNCRHSGQSFVAEIPQPVAQAELVESPADDNPAQIVSIEPMTPNHATMPVAPIQEIESPITAVNGQQSNIMDVPIAVDVVEVEKSALERMQELEAIKAFLSDAEYETKRQEILDSI